MSTLKQSQPHTYKVEPELLNLVSDVIQGNEAAFNKLHARFKDYVSNVAYSFCSTRPGAHEMAKDISQIVWDKINVHINGLQDPANFQTWLYHVIRNTSINFVKGNDLRTHFIRIDGNGQIHGAHSTLTELSAPKMDSSFLDAKNIDFASIRQALDKLSPTHKEVIVLTYFQGYSGTDIARMLQVKEGTVRSRHSYALVNLKKYLKKSNS